MRRLIALLAALCLPALAHADLLTDVGERITKAPVVRGEFTQTRELSGIKKPVSAEGQFLVLRGQGVLWSTTKPFGSSLRVTSTEILQRDARGNSLRLRADGEPVVGTISQVLMGVMAGDFTQLDKLFTVSGKLDGKRWQLALAPREAAMAKVIGEIRVAGASTVEDVVLDAPNGDRTRIEMRKVTTAQQAETAERAAFE
ncbi:outer membrane lipoprotein carrier protein LolA [Uliginosibacterium sp. H1]|uniref:outer membrane lipoprotein carrier protein LolA n=1 Tax=Uliginosibacterium sp. H1 TaxID=3114757 RepID=UPI002E18FCC2|nr:outer membrane lipoprotein carrier protein LolA [Uliginosibacterium sp. H1]